ncbi:MAG: Na(+)-translocating NADH-quinone reductase subunit C [Bacteroidetes bacterium HGW-Bacteroidetes-2]|jgi:Na+-transporting NADH:ubiquinone oxidoreductase subunit C|nr:MAG: Na(+)-translocating NADH-quinone reductase subunit C [Bacteroidetes bacterium HGW-Bacteroidetes-2]
MAKKTDSNLYTFLFAILMVVVVGSILAFVASALKPTITENQRFEKQQNILYAMGVNNNQEENDVVFISTDKVGQVFKETIIKQLVFQGDKVIEDDEAYLIDLAKEDAQAKKAGYERRLPLFIGEKDGKTFYIVPMRGKGLWDAIWGFISLDENLVVQGVFFDHKGETPGLGANIKERYFMDDFKEEFILDENQNFASIKITKGNNDPLNNRKEDNKVDALAGATITGNGVTAMIKKYLRIYLPHLKTLTK